MKEKTIYVIVLVCLLLAAICGIGFPKTSAKRIHHHLQTVKKSSRSAGEFSSHLPIISIDTHHQQVPEQREYEGETKRQKTIKTTVSLRDQLDREHSLSESPRLSLTALIAYRGNSSRHFDKKSLKLRFINKSAKPKAVSLAGMSKESEWVLHGPFLDRTLVRNYLSYNIAGEIMTYAPNVRYCELVVDHQYCGLYLAVESIEQGRHRVNIEKSDRKSDKTPYILVWDRRHKAKQALDHYVSYTNQAGLSSLDIKYPSLHRLTPKQKQFIEKDISHIEKLLYSYDLKQYTDYLDQESFADYFIINEFFRNIDAGKFSTYLYKDLRDKLKLVVWDFNNAFDNQIEAPYDEADFTLSDAPWFCMLLKDPSFVKLVVTRYHQLRQNVLSTDYLIKYIDATVAFLGPAIQRNYHKWGYVFTVPSRSDATNYLVPASRNYRSYEASVKQLKDFIRRRGRWLDKHIETLYQYSAPSKNTNTLLE
ncbi:TPA: CotH kinase family protein [Streptococcus equi subsp. zooepidemicus]|nr:CotH kinase family protein [Streptococcus equi subsp. zooepidemicus]HEL0712409.1 CotH kinase family protein [Streptococcus equi subsp. zooepidemicus]HEL0737199.1 CotH kinase family protein [Streptococcus equi subsp. zooepidemicus]HEL0767328.1 CotH kinase family protein [Streptococcus equi subsp. zooepidemicus]HEL1301406.1 CotH kinase family protein [Streptococcus equi subsp. zooepidemicus]